MRRGELRAGVGAALGVALVAGWLLLRLPHGRAVSDLSVLAGELFAAAAAARAARRAAGRVRNAWTLLAASSGTVAVGEIVWTVYQLALGRALPAVPIVGFCWLLSVPLALAGLLALPAAPSRSTARLRLIIDGLMVATALLVASWSPLLAPLYGRRDDQTLLRAVGLLFPLADVLVLTVAVLVAARARGRWTTTLLLVAAAMAGRALADGAFVTLALREEYRTGLPMDVCWVAAFVLIGFAALLDPADDAAPLPGLGRAPRARALLPYLPVVAALLVSATARPGLRSPALLAANVAVVLLVLARQAVTAVENAALTADLTRLAYSDVVTGLGNRTMFSLRLRAAVDRAARDGGRVAVLLLDMDGFKAVNDSLGHAAGDRLLAVVARRLAAAARTRDVVVRLGGDEFGVLLAPASKGASLGTGRRLLDALDDPIEVENRVVRVSASIGVAEWIGPGEPPEDLLRDADVAMYAAKAAGRACVRQFEPGMRRAVVAKAELEADLRHALVRDELRVRYQPVVDLPTGVLYGVEALVRWQHPVRGTLSPAAFVPLAGETGLVGELDRWVLAEACRCAARWQQSRPGFRVNVNVEAAQFARTDLVGVVTEVLAAANLPPSCLTLEMTETALVEDTEATIGRLSALAALGVRVAIDDFGTGYSCLAYLGRLPVDALKIDRSFVDKLGHDRESMALVQAILGLARTFGLRTVAEGVETTAQRDLLRDLGCDSGQGYLYSPPVEASVIDEMLTGPAAAVDLARRPGTPAPAPAVDGPVAVDRGAGGLDSTAPQHPVPVPARLLLAGLPPGGLVSPPLRRPGVSPVPSAAAGEPPGDVVADGADRAAAVDGPRGEPADEPAVDGSDERAGRSALSGRADDGSADSAGDAAGGPADNGGAADGGQAAAGPAGLPGADEWARALGWAEAIEAAEVALAQEEAFADRIRDAVRRGLTSGGRSGGPGSQARRNGTPGRPADAGGVPAGPATGSNGAGPATPAAGAAPASRNGVPGSPGSAPDRAGTPSDGTGAAAVAGATAGAAGSVAAGGPGATDGSGAADGAGAVAGPTPTARVSAGGRAADRSGDSVPVPREPPAADRTEIAASEEVMDVVQGRGEAAPAGFARAGPQRRRPGRPRRGRRG